MKEMSRCYCLIQDRCCNLDNMKASRDEVYVGTANGTGEQLWVSIH